MNLHTLTAPLRTARRVLHYVTADRDTIMIPYAHYRDVRDRHDLSVSQEAAARGKALRTALAQYADEMLALADTLAAAAEAGTLDMQGTIGTAAARLRDLGGQIHVDAGEVTSE